MTPTPPSPENDILDLAGLDMEPKKPKASTPESDFEKELEALFAEDLTEPEVKAPAAASVAAPAAPAAGEDVLSLEDLVPEPAPAAPAAGDAEDVLDLGAFAAPAASQADDDEVLDLGAFASGGEMDITPPEETPGGKDGGIDTAALDDLISGLGDAGPPAAEPPHDVTDMSDLLETLDVPKAAAKAEPVDELMELSLGDLVEGMPEVEPLAEPPAEPEGAAPAAELPDLDISLPDLSDPEPLHLAEPDMGGDLNLSLADAAPEAAEQPLGTSALDLSGLMEGGLMEGLEGPAEEAAAGQPLDAATLLDQVADAPPAAEAAPELTPAAPIPPAALRELQEKLAAIATQVTGGSVAVVRLEGQLAEKDQAISALEQSLHVSQDEAHSLRRELSDLRAQLEETLRQRAQAEERAATEFKERLALVEDRQIQIDRDVRTEIERAVPREAARVIREEIAALAASMRDE